MVAPDSPKGKGSERFKQLDEERSKGWVRAEAYPNSQLYKGKEELEALESEPNRGRVISPIC